MEDMMENQNIQDTQVLDAESSESKVESAGVGSAASEYVVRAADPAPVPMSRSMQEFALPQDYVDGIADTVQAAVPIQKPKKQEFISPHPHLEARMFCGIVVDDESGEHYVLHPALVDEFSDECRRTVLVPYMLRDGSVRLWPIGRRDETGNWNPWHQSAHTIAGKYANKWVRVIAARGIGAYKAQEPVSCPDAPVWSEVDIPGLYADMLNVSAIEDRDHPFLRKLRGEDL
jgi:hypothetical protein